MLADGIYIIKDSLGSAGDEKTLITGAYNNRGLVLTDTSTNFIYLGLQAWDVGNYFFVQDDDAFYVTTHDIIKRYDFNIQNCSTVWGYGCDHNTGPGAKWLGCNWNIEYNSWCDHAEIEWDEELGEFHIRCEYYNEFLPNISFWQDAISAGDNFSIIYGDRYDYYTFPTPAESGDIISVAVWAEVRGKCALSLNTVYGEPTSETHQFEWESLTYTAKPAGGAWAWSDLASGTLIAGVKCYYRIEKNDSGTCRRLKVVITTTTGTITLWPSGDYIPDYAYCLQPVCGNYLEDLDKGDELADTVCDDGGSPPVLYRAGSATVTDPCIISDLSEVAPRFSVINSVNVFAKYTCNNVSGSTGYVRLFIEVNGTKYYSSSTTLNDAGASVEQTITNTWSTNPATGLAWDYDDYKAIKFGLHAHLDDSPQNQIVIFQLYATTAFQEQKLEPGFTQLDANFVSFREESQTPKLVAPDLRFRSPIPLSERLRVLYVCDATPRFVGFVWSCEGGPGEYEIIAKGYQEVLKYRYLPNVTYSPKLDGLSARLTLDDILSAEPPTHPLHSHIGITRVQDDSLTTTPDWVDSLADRIVISHESFCGLFWVLNSYIPAGNGEASGKIPTLGGLATGRPVFGADRQIAQINYPYTIFYGSVEWMYSYASHYYDTTDYEIFGTGNSCHGAYGSSYYSDGFQIDGLRRLEKNSSSTCTDEQYYPSSDGGLYVAAWPDHQLIFIDTAMDCYIDLDENEEGDKYLNETLIMNGSADSIISNIFELSGQEVVASPGWDGRLHLSAKINNGRGSEASPIFAFIDGENCQVETSTATDPPIDAAVGYDEGCGAALDLAQVDARFCKCVRTDRTGPDLDNYLDAILDSDKTEYKITSLHFGLRPLDWISIDGQAVRVRSVEEYPDRAVITAGKKLIDMGGAFGEWLNKPADSDMSQVISMVEFEDADYPITQAFTVKASDYKRSDWQARLNLSWKLTVPNAATVAALTETPKAWITIGDKVIDPGKILLTGKSGSVTVDISDACSKSTTADTSNTLKVYLEDHLSETASPTFFHTVTGKIEQIRVAAVLENA